MLLDHIASWRKSPLTSCDPFQRMCKWLKATHLFGLQVVQVGIPVLAGVRVRNALHLLCGGIPPGSLRSPEDSVLRCLQNVSFCCACARLNHLLIDGEPAKRLRRKGTASGCAITLLILLFLGGPKTWAQLELRREKKRNSLTSSFPSSLTSCCAIFSSILAT